jgi:N-acetyl-gamma-glutamyl-phosphate/LysW-gamma-L-alpha-aminoadipyl-6-phosphate reductase
VPFSSSDIVNNCDLVVCATPHGITKDIVPSFLDAGLKIIDLSADYRLKDPADYPEWYGWEHPHPELLERSVLGLPELYRSSIKDADLIACPGCMAEASILALIPLVREGLIETNKIVVDAKIGSSGGGSEPTYAGHHPERFGGLRPYKVVGHRHTAEIEQELSLHSHNNEDIKIAFTPHAVNMARGILVTCHTWISSSLQDKDVWGAYRGVYNEEPFVRLVKYKKGLYQLPDPKVVVGTNHCDIGFMLDHHTGRLVSFAAIDNIIKGAAGQGVHCLNIMLGLDETTGLDMFGLH